jgi:kynurenine 3-monooxygenase
MSEIAVIGAGLVGCLAAIGFAKKGYKVALYEGRPDLRLPEEQAKSSLRSINLAVSARGILALKSVDREMADRVLSDLIPMSGRMIHGLDGSQKSQNYGLYGESINSINRALLNRSLLDELDKVGVQTFFDYKLVRADLRRNVRPSLLFRTAEGEEIRKEVDVVIGADGSFSTVRNQIQRVVQMNFSQQYIDHYYLELKIGAGPNNTFALDPNHLHIWPRHEFMLIALANGDKTFTSTLFAPRAIFDKLDQSWDKFKDFFGEQFPDAVKLIGLESLKNSFENNPRGSLVSVKCSPYNAGGRAILIGDSAHSMVPFYGQGMNCGFEDVRTLLECLDATKFDFEKGFDLYSKTRHKDLLSIVDLSMRNYIEMRHSVTSSLYLLRKAVDGLLSRTLGDAWLPLYTMVSFRPDIPYSRAIEQEERQKNIINYGLISLGAITVVGSILFKRVLRS